jgi:hypothetical protein
METERKGPAIRFERYGDVAGLDPVKLWALLRDGDAPERVWAVWALALKEGEQALPSLKPLLREEPDSGVRRHLLNVFAGHGDLDAVAHVACWDTAPWVRQAALTFLCRIAPRKGDPVWRLLADRLVSEPDNRVACEVVRALPEGWPQLVQDRLEALADRPAGRLRIAARGRLGFALEKVPEPAVSKAATPDRDDWRRYLPVLWQPPLPERRPSSGSLCSGDGCGPGAADRS